MKSEKVKWKARGMDGNGEKGMAREWNELHPTKQFLALPGQQWPKRHRCVRYTSGYGRRADVEPHRADVGLMEGVGNKEKGKDG